MAPLAAALVSGQLDFRAIGPRTTAVEPGHWREARRDGDSMHGSVILADRFGNLLTNIEESALVAGGRWEIEIKGTRLPTVLTYGELEDGALGALINSHGVIEIAQREGNAATHLEVVPGEPVTVHPR
jgi:S-adenosylmethionine hydrolase